MRPVLDVPTATPWSTSTLLARASMTIASGRRTAIRDLAAVASALAIVLFGIVLIEASLSPFPVVLAMLAMAVSPTFWLHGVSWSNDALAPVLAMLAAWLALRGIRTGRRAFVIAAFISGGLALAEDPAWLAILPGVAVLCWTRLANGRERTQAAIALTVLAACAAWPLLMLSLVARNLAGPMITGEVPPIFTLWRQSMMAAERTALLPALQASIPAEFTLIGGVTAGVGVAVLLDTRSARYAVAGTLAALLAWLWLAPHPAFAHVSVPLAMSGWAAAAVGLAAAYRTLSPKIGGLVVLGAALVTIGQPALPRVRAMAWSGPDSTSDTRRRSAYDFRIADLPEGTSVVSETRSVDAALLLSSYQAGRPLIIVPQTIEHVAAATAGGRPVAALPGAHANLARAGFVFERSWIGNVPLAIAGGRAACVDVKQGEPVDVSLQLISGSFSLHGATPAAAPGTMTVRLTGVEDIPVVSSEPRRLRYEIISAPRAPEVVLRILRSRSASTAVLNLSGAPAKALATAETAIPVSVCPDLRRSDLLLGRSETALASIDMTAAAPFGTGWHFPEVDSDPFRWTGSNRSEFRVTIAPPGPVRVTVTATPAARADRQPSIALVVNDCRMPGQPMPPGQGDYVWDVDARCWQPGTNRLWLEQGPLVSPRDAGLADSRQLGARIGAIRIARLPRDSRQNEK